MVIVGSSGVGKTSLVQRFVTGKFLPMKRTVGADFSVYTYKIEGLLKVKLQIWDFAGEAKFRVVLPSYVRGATGCLLCYDMTNDASFYVLPEWYNIVSQRADNAVFGLIGCKQDLLRNHKRIDDSYIDNFVEGFNITFFYETSSKIGHNTELVFRELIKQILKTRYNPAIKNKTTNRYSNLYTNNQ